MPERDWEEDDRFLASIVFVDGEDAAVKINAAKAFELYKLACVAANERRRLADLLTWKPGPPTEPGLYCLSFDYMRPHFVSIEGPIDMAFWDRPGANKWWLGPLPEPPKAEVAG